MPRTVRNVSLCVVHSHSCVELPIRQVVPAERKTVLFVSSWVFHCLDSREGVPAYSLTKNAKQWFLLLVSRSLVAASAPLPFAVVAILVALPFSAFSISFRTFCSDLPACRQLANSTRTSQG